LYVLNSDLLTDTSHFLSVFKITVLTSP